MLETLIFNYAVQAGLSLEQADGIKAQEDGSFALMLLDRYLLTLEQVEYGQGNYVRALCVLEGDLSAPELISAMSRYAGRLTLTPVYGQAVLGLSKETGIIYISLDLNSDTLDDDSFVAALNQFTASIAYLTATPPEQNEEEQEISVFAQQDPAIFKNFLAVCQLSFAELQASLGRYQVSDDFALQLKLSEVSGRIVLSSFIADALKPDDICELLQLNSSLNSAGSLIWRDDALLFEQFLEPKTVTAKEFAVALNSQKRCVDILAEEVATLQTQNAEDSDDDADVSEDEEDVAGELSSILFP